MTRLSLVVDLDFGGAGSEAMAPVAGDLLAGADTLAAAGFAGVVVRRLVAAGFGAGLPERWHIAGVNVSVAAPVAAEGVS